MPRTRRVESEREQERVVDEHITRGYKVEQRSQRSVRVKEKDWGSPPVHGFVFLFALLGGGVLFDAANAPAGGAWILAFLANLTYAAYSWFTAEEIIIRVDESSDGGSDGDNEESETSVETEDGAETGNREETEDGAEGVNDAETESTKPNGTGE